MKTLNEIAENYFNTLNPLAERISNDILVIKEAYEELWNSLSEKEQNQIINEAVVHPEALLKYALESNSPAENGDLPLFNTVTGSKFVVDENTGNLWRDEHSAPFSWKTPSQINLAIFTTSNEDICTAGDISTVKSKQKTIQPLTSEKTFDLKFQKKDTWNTNEDKTDFKENTLSPESNVVLMGTCSRLSGLCSKLKFLPSKSYSYEVQTVITHPTDSNETSFLDRLKSTAVLKLHNTLKLMGGKGSDKKMSESKAVDSLIQTKGAPTIVKLSKTSPKVSKPTSPPPPPPVLSLPLRSDATEEGKNGKNLIYVKSNISETYQEEMDSEKMNLLQEKDFLSTDLESGEQDSQLRFVHEVSDDFNTLSTECTPLSGPTTDTIPKSGFDFLDNW
ncbi:hypothetical protein RUM44_001048 [Polyplax serrata]|uniref:DUF4706 domain-containing protein n=1 Tax=Polyplax serrata TaxID=468196 RepID=A0ABR1B9G7_POLSC